MKATARRRVGGVDVAVSPVVPENNFVLVTGTLSGEGVVELRRRVAAGEVAEHVLAELLVKEGKAVIGWVP